LALQISGTVGGFFAVVTFGASMLPCAAAAAAANNACRIRDEKKDNLDSCLAHHAHLAQQAQEMAERAMAVEQARQARIEQLNADFLNRRDLIIHQYDQMIRDFIENFITEGWNIEDPESQELLRATQVNMERERNERLDQLEVERRQAVAHV
jgi:hypothetical protein